MKQARKTNFLPSVVLGLVDQGADHDHFGIFANPGGGDGIARGVGADDGQDIVLADEFLSRGGRGFGLVFVILDKQLNGIFRRPP